MARLAAILLAVLLTPTLPAQETVGGTLNQWSAKGGAASSDSTAVTLPAGTQLTRSFDAAQLSVRLTSRPLFTATVTASPSLEVGPASLSFLRDAVGGAVVLLGDKPLSLPMTIPLDAEGRSQAPLDFTLSYNQLTATARLAIADQNFSLPATAPAGSLQITLSAGEKAAWVLNTAVVTVTGSAGVAAADDSVAGKSAASSESAQARALDERTRFFDGLASAVSRGVQSPEQALAQLRTLSTLRYKFDGDVDFALAAIELGERLVGSSHYDAAEPFFRAAEPVLVLARRRSTEVGEQIVCLKHLAWIRSRYLKEEEQAKADIEAAYQLNPRDGSLRDLRERFTGRKETTKG